MAGPPALHAAVARQIPETRIVQTGTNPQLPVYVYAPPAPAGQGAPLPATQTPIIFYSGEWGWRPLQQDTSSSLAAAGRCILGIDSPEYFTGIIPAEVMAAEFKQFRSVVNERAGRPKDAPVIVIGFASGAEIVPYVLNRIGAAGVRGLVLIAPDRTGASVFRVSLQLKMDSPADETFDVRSEIARLPPMPLVFMEGSLDGESAAKALSDAARGSHRYAPVIGGDRQFHEVRDLFFRLLADAIQWIDAGGSGSGASAPAVPPPGPGHAPGPAGAPDSIPAPGAAPAPRPAPTPAPPGR
ncbi:MAG: hypothetical protein DMF51_06260 [Acidobacteria bacterium]|nr:MAG: hypothetical protein DMF51_06260 [Acidobacteriota bacterium]